MKKLLVALLFVLGMALPAHAEPTTVVYSSPGVDLLADITPGNGPVVILIHGGQWIKGDRTALWKAADVLSQKGWVTMSVDYRMACPPIRGPLCGYYWPTPVIDVQAAVDWAEQNISAYGGDPNRISLLGSSAGADIALEMAVSGHGITSVAAWSPPVGFEGCTDICAPMQNYLHCPRVSPCDPALMHAATPAFKVTPATIPAIVFNSTDEQIPLWMPTQYVDAMNLNGVRNEFVVIPGTAHAKSYQMYKLADGATVLDHTAAFLGGLPMTNPKPTLGVKSKTSWDLGFRVETVRPTNVVAKWRVTCTNGGVAIPERGKVRGMTPMVRHLDPSIQNAESCRLRVVAWDIPPHVRPHNWPAPVVTTWVTHD